MMGTSPTRCALHSTTKTFNRLYLENVWQTPGLICKSCNSEAWNSESWTWREGYGESSPPGKAGLGFNMFEHVKKLLKSTEKGKNI